MEELQRLVVENIRLQLSSSSINIDLLANFTELLKVVSDYLVRIKHIE